MDELEAIQYRPLTGPDGANVSWRTGHFSDWELVLGDRRFRTHKAIVARASEVLAASMNASYGSTCTDLTALLPPVAHPVFELVLEEIYEGNCAVDDTQLVLIFAVADILGMRALFGKILSRIKERIRTRAVSFLQDVHQLPRSEHLGVIASAARRCMARDFVRYCCHDPGGLAQLTEEDVVAILTCEDLAAREDEVFDFLMNYLDASSCPSADPEQTQRCHSEADLWRHCRLAFVSQDRLLRLRSRLSSKGGCQGAGQILMDALMYRTSLDRAAPDKDLQKACEEIYPRGWLEPRRPPHIDPPKENELDFIVHLPRDPEKVFAKGHCIRSTPKEMDGGIRVSILVFPNGTAGTRPNTSLTGSTQLARVPIFVEVVPAKQPPEDADWVFRRNYFISVWPWEAGQSTAIRKLRDGVDELREEKNPDVNPAEINERTGAVRWIDKHHFKPSLPDRGWYEFPHQKLRACCDANGFLWLRARVWTSPVGGRW